MYTPHSIPCALLLLLSLTACQQEVLTEEKRPALPQEAPISFTRGMVDNVSRVGNGLEEYATTMGVWGWRKQDGEKEQVFRHQRVYYDQAEQGWFYSPLKYWNTRSTYDFYAYAPYEPSLVTIEDGKWIHIVGVSVAGENVQETPHAQEVKVFSQDTDWMVARAGQTDVPGTYGATVQFCMQHVLSKLNVRIRTSQEMADATTSVTLDELTIGTFAASGSFAQQLLHTPVTAAERAVEEWTLAPGAQGLTLGRTTGCTIPTSYSYVLESLLLPQAVDMDDALQMAYTLHYADGHGETFRYSLLLREASADFETLVSGCNYTLSFTIAPSSIQFQASAYQWADGETGDLALP